MSAAAAAATVASTVSSAIDNSQPILLNALANLINKSVDAAQKGGEFLIGQLPDVIHQLLVYKAVFSFLICFGGLVLIIIGVVTGFKTRKQFIEDEEVSDIVYSYAIVTIILLIIGFAFLLTHMQWLQILIAPKIYLIEYSADLISSLRGK